MKYHNETGTVIFRRFAPVTQLPFLASTFRQRIDQSVKRFRPNVFRK